MEDKSIKAYCFHTPRYSPLAKNLKDSLKYTGGEIELQLSLLDAPIEDHNKCLHPKTNTLTLIQSPTAVNLKLKSILSAIENNMGRVIIHCDADIVFLAPLLHLIPTPVNDWDLCAPQYFPNDPTVMDWGFLIINCTAKTHDFFTNILALSQERPDSMVENFIMKSLHTLRYRPLGEQFATYTNRGLENKEKTVIYHHNKWRFKVDRINQSLRAEIQLLSKYESFHSNDPRLLDPNPIEKQTRRKRLQLAQQEQETLIADFVHDGCLDHSGNPIDMECTQLWENYQNELQQPGCKSCTKRKIVKKYFNLINKTLS